MTLTIALIALPISAACFFYSWTIPPRKGFWLEKWWGPVRGFAKLKYALIGRGWAKPIALLATEAFSAALHAPIAFFAGYMADGNLVTGGWLTVATVVFWLGYGIGRASLLDNQEKKLRALVENDDEAIEVFLKNPVAHLRGLHGTDPWGEGACANLYVEVGGRAIGYVHGITIFTTARRAEIRHIAVERGLEGRGLGRHLALIMRAELARRFKVTEIVFMESSTRYAEAGYPAFFSSLGAQSQVRQGWEREQWVWTC